MAMTLAAFGRRIKDSIPVVGFAAAAVVSCGGDQAAPRAVPRGRTPIVILAVDGLRADALGSSGASVQTPALDALAAQSVRFAWAFAQAPQLQPSLATLFSGMYPSTNGLREPGDHMAEEARTLAEVLGAVGYRTAAFAEGVSGDSDRGLAQGFDSYQTTAFPATAAAEWMGSHLEEDFLLVVAGWARSVPEEAEALRPGRGSPEGVDGRLQGAPAPRAQRAPIDSSDAKLEWGAAWYAAKVQAVDSLLAGFMAQYRQAGLDQRAILVVLGCNGYALGEHGDLAGASLYTPVTHVPVMVRFPGGRGAQVVGRVVEVLDLMPTLLDLAGVEAPAGVQGKSLLPILEETSQPPYVAFGESPQFGGQRFVALGGMGMVSGIGGEEAAIYDLGLDPRELVDLADTEGRKLEVMVRHLQAWEKMTAGASLDPDLRSEEELDEGTLQQLKSLGYIQ